MMRTFGWASFLNDFGSDMIFPVWPVFVTKVLGANMAVLGFLDGMGETLVSLSHGLAGYWSDRIRKRKVFIWVGYLCATLSRLGYALSTNWTQLIPFRALDRMGKIRSAPRDAIIADLSIRENRGRYFGFLRTMDNFGALCGILVCIFLIEKIGYQKLFLLAALPSALGVVLILRRISEQIPAQKIYQGVKIKVLNLSFLLFLILSAVFSLGSFSYSFLLMSAGEAGFKNTSIPILYLLFTAVATFSSLPFGYLADRISRKAVLLISFLLWAGICALFIFGGNKWLILIAFILYGLQRGSLDTVQRAFVAELVPEEYRASCLGGFGLVTGVCALPASWGAGILWETLGRGAPFIFSLATTGVALGLLLFVREQGT